MEARRPKFALWATVNITGYCNLKCSYCFFQPRLNKHMPFQDFKMVVDALKKQNVFFLTISGGEPFLHPQFGEIIKYAHKIFDHVSVLSNGTSVQNKHYKGIQEIIRNKGAFQLQVSIDSIESEINDTTRGKTNKVLKNLEELKDAGATITVAIVLTSKNINEVVNTILALKHITRHFHVMPFKPVPFLDGNDNYLQPTTDEMKVIWSDLEKLRGQNDLLIKIPADGCKSKSYTATGAPCAAGFTQLVIDPNLDVRACSKCVHAVVGNLKNEDFKSIWNGPKLAHIYKRSIPYCEVASEWKAKSLELNFETVSQ